MEKIEKKRRPGWGDWPSRHGGVLIDKARPWPSEKRVIKHMSYIRLSKVFTGS